MRCITWIVELNVLSVWMCIGVCLVMCKVSRWLILLLSFIDPLCSEAQPDLDYIRLGSVAQGSVCY